MDRRRFLLTSLAGVLAAPLAHGDHAVRACYAALRMQESVKRYAEGVRREQGVTIRIRVGLNSGEVARSRHQSPPRLTYLPGKGTTLQVSDRELGLRREGVRGRGLLDLAGFQAAF